MRFLLGILTVFSMLTANALGVSSDVTYSQGYQSTPIPAGSGSYGVLLQFTNDAPVSGTFTCATSDICTKASHGYSLGLLVRVSNSGGALPTGLSAATDYFVVPVTSGTFSLADSAANAVAGTILDISGVGSGTQTVIPTALAGASVKLQGSYDDSVWADIPVAASGDLSKSASISGTGNVYLYVDKPNMNFIRPYFTITSGQLSTISTSKSGR